ncbi:MAG: hypothetical protein J7L07_08780 [Candidatus Odinarchaeota archaeon]|nr:hypothetical protein [Candidatus Odinarchaeota archaeon]
MVKEFLEITSPDVFLRIAEKATFVIRVDPFMFAQYFGFMFFIDLTKLSDMEVGRILRLLREKFVVTKRIIKADSITDFLEKMKSDDTAIEGTTT